MSNETNALQVVIDDYRNTAENGQLIWALRMADAAAQELANYETACQEDARRMEQVTAERDAMREALQKIATTHRLDPRLAGVAYGYQQIALAALKGGKG